MLSTVNQQDETITLATKANWPDWVAPVRKPNTCKREPSYKQPLVRSLRTCCLSGNGAFHEDALRRPASFSLRSVLLVFELNIIQPPLRNGLPPAKTR